MKIVKDEKNNLIRLDDSRAVEDLVKNKVGNKFVIGFMDENGNCGTYISEYLTDMELCYIIDCLDKRRIQ